MSVFSNPIVSWFAAIVVGSVIAVGIIVIGAGVSHLLTKAHTKIRSSRDVNLVAHAGTVPMLTINWDRPTIETVDGTLQIAGDAELIEQDEDGRITARHKVSGLATTLPRLPIHGDVAALQLVCHSGSRESIGVTYESGMLATIQLMS